MRYLLFLALLAGSAFSENLNSFPLWGSSWIVAQGRNSRIFPSALPLRPDKLALIDFRSNKSVTVRYANLNHRTYRCTAELVEDVRTQFELNSVELLFDEIVTGSVMNVAYQPFDDTVWTGDPEAVDHFNKYRSVGRIVDNTDILFGPGDANKLRNTPAYFRTKPVYYGVRSAGGLDGTIYTIESIDDNGERIFLENRDYVQSSQTGSMKDLAFTDLQSFSEETPFVNYRKGNTIYEHIPCEYSYKTENVGFWQIHLHPEMWYYPVDPFEGVPIIEDELKMDRTEALEKRKESLAAPDNLDLKYYRRPYLSDSASVIISFAFTNTPGTDMTQLSSLSLVDAAVEIDHYPERMYRIAGFGDPDRWGNYKSALYQLYSEDEVSERRNRRIDTRCPGWTILDKQNAELIFPTAMQEANRLVRDRTVDDGIFTYNDCPCSRIPTLRDLTAVQLQRLVFQTPPLCDRGEMMKAISVYRQMLPHLTKPSDQDLLKQKTAIVQRVIDERDRRASIAEVDWSSPNEECPNTWVDLF